MPTIVVRISKDTTRKKKQALDGKIRDAILKTAEELKEKILIPDRYNGFRVLIGGEKMFDEKQASVQIIMLPRSSKKQLEYTTAVGMVFLKSGITALDITFLNVKEEDWR